MEMPYCDIVCITPLKPMFTNKVLNVQNGANDIQLVSQAPCELFKGLENEVAKQEAG